jgi:hypothetical protein
LSSYHSVLYCNSTSRRLRDIVIVCTGDCPKVRQKEVKNNKVPSRQTSSRTFPRLLPSAKGRMASNRCMVGSIQLPLVAASSSCCLLNAPSSDISCTTSSNIVTQSRCVGNCCFHTNEMALCGRRAPDRGLESSSHVLGSGIDGGMSCANDPIKSPL